jgi:hypothetical protein
MATTETAAPAGTLINYQTENGLAWNGRFVRASKCLSVKGCAWSVSFSSICSRAKTPTKVWRRTLKRERRILKQNNISSFVSGPLKHLADLEI